MQYKLYTVSINHDSNIVTGATGTKFLANAQAGNAFKIKDDPVIYTIASVPSDTQIILSAPYQGLTASGLQYQITRDYTTHYQFAEVSVGDQDWPIHLTQETIRKIDTIIANLEARVAVLEAQ